MVIMPDVGMEAAALYKREKPPVTHEQFEEFWCRLWGMGPEGEKLMEMYRQPGALKNAFAKA